MIPAALTLRGSRPHSMWNGNELKSTSVPDFRRNGSSLQLRGVKWTSPQHFTHGFDSLHLGGDANL